jgi:putative proteasome-type protease
MTFFEMPGERVIVLLSAGNLAVSQSVTGLLRERVTSAKSSLLTTRSMSDAARLVGDAVRDVYHRDAAPLKEHGIEFNPTFIVGGQIGGESPRLFHVYSAGNFIETTADTRYFQIGESKYGKPIIDRVVKADTPLAAAVAKCALISMDSTIRSNLSVGMPLDLAIVRRDALAISLHRNIGPDDAYFKVIRDGWGESLRNAFHALPDPSIP